MINIPIRLTQVPQNNTTGENTDPIGYETTYDGQTFFWASGQLRALGNDGQGIGHSINQGAGAPAAGVIQDNLISTKYYTNPDSRS